MTSSKVLCSFVPFLLHLQFLTFDFVAIDLAKVKLNLLGLV